MNARLLLLQLCVTLVLFLVVRALLQLRARKRRARRPGVRNRKQSPRPCATVPPTVYRRPDPMIYDQFDLMQQGFAVTWDNPDIHLELGGAVVPAESILPATTYDVVARIWNGATDAPAVDLPVRLSYLTFGIGQTRVAVGETSVDLPVKGAPGCPAFARIPWTTPATPGHYCLQVELVWSDDANPNNNLGQHNTNVKPLNSPRATFTFPVRNDGARRREFVLEVDGYLLPSRQPCPDDAPGTPPRTAAEEVARRRAARARHDRARHPVPAGWRVEVEPRELALAPGEERQVTVDVTAVDGFVGRQALNVHGFDVSIDRARPRLVGGVTLYVTGTG